MERSNFQDQEGDGKDIIKPSLRDLVFDNENPSQDWIEWALLIYVLRDQCCGGMWRRAFGLVVPDDSKDRAFISGH